MNADQLLHHCAAQGVQLWVEGNRLKFRAQKGTLTPELKAQIGAAREALIALLRWQNLDEPTICELSYGQRAFWFLHQTAPHNSAFNLSFAARIRSPLDEAALKNSFQILLDRHGALRTTFAVIDGRPGQRIHGAQDVAFRVLQAQGWDRARVLREVERLHRLPFDLESGPLLRVQVLHCGELDHVLVLTIHHIVCDGWSFAILLEEWRHIYTAEIQRQPLPRPAAASPYSTFVTLERELLAGPAGERLHRYWAQQLGQDMPILELPLDRPRPGAPRFVGTSHTFTLAPPLTAKLKQRAASQSVTQFVLLLAAYGLLLHRHSGQQRVVIGTPTFGRNRPEFRKTVGCFINQVALALDFSGDPDLKGLLGRTRTTLLGALEHQGYPFHLIAEHFWHHSDHSIPPVCQAEFVFLQNQEDNQLAQLFNPQADTAPIPFGPLLLERIPLEQQEGQLDLTLEVMESAGALIGTLKGNADIFNPESIVRMAGEYQQILTQLADGVQGAVASVALMTPEERHQVLGVWSGASQHGVAPLDPVERLAAQVRLRPEAVAVVHEGQSLCYGELGRRVDQMAEELRRASIGPGMLVGLFCERSLEMIVGLLAVLQAGGAYVPLDPEYPRERLQFMLADARISVVLTTTALADQLPAGGLHALCLDQPEARPDAAPVAAAGGVTSEPGSGSPANRLAYLIYTSGSTGTPKGVMVARRALHNFVGNAVDLYGITPGDRVLQFASMNFDASIEEILPCLTQGATLVLRTADMLDAMATFVERCRLWGITVLDLPTAFWHELTLGLGNHGLRLPESVRLVIIGGEKAHPETLALWQACVQPTVRLLNTYGPTESTVVATACDLSALALPAGQMAAVPIGRPLANLEAYILDTRMQPVPVGVFGELHLGGAGLADGYWDRPQLTAEKFVAHPFSDDPAARLYKTGDLARFLADGQIEFRGRIDSQVKIRGFRIELGEIESVLLQHPLVESVHVLARSTGSGPASLVAYYVPAVGGDDPDDAVPRLQDHCQQQLPEYMVPSAWVRMTQLPRTGSGKIDARALPEPGDRDQPGAEFVAAQTPTEARLAAIWAEALQVSRISVQQDFFSLGGDSLLVLRVVAVIQHTWGLALPFRQFFETPTVAALARFIDAVLFFAPEVRAATAAEVDRVLRDTAEEAQPPGLRATIRSMKAELVQALAQLKRGQSPPLPPLTPQAEGEGAPMTFAQQRLWFLAQWQPDSPAYNMSWALEWRGALDTRALEEAFNQLVRRHAVLRTRFGEKEGRLWQYCRDQVVLSLTPVAADAVAPPGEGPLAVRLLPVLAREADHPFDLRNDPLIRASLYRLDAAHHVVLLVIHHGIFDGWSFDILVRELFILYTSQRSGRGVELPVLQYRDFSWWQQEHCTEAELTRQLEFWRHTFSGELQQLDLPLDYPRPPEQTFHGAQVQTRITDNRLQAVRQLAVEANASLYMVGLAVFAFLLHRWSGQTDIIVGSPFAGRRLQETEGMIGFFVNTVALRLNLAGTDSFRELLRLVREVVLEAQPHQDVPFEKIVEALNLPRDPSRTPLFQVFFNHFRSQLEAVPELPEAQLSLLAGYQGETQAKFDLSFYMEETEAALQLRIVYNADLFTASSMALFLEQFTGVLARVVARPDQELTDLQLTTDRDQAVLPDPAQPLGWEWEGPITARLAQWAKVQGQATAVEDAAERLSYAELEQLSNRLAQRLAAADLGPEAVVAVYGERCCGLVVALLAIIKARAVFLVLDPGFPAPRLGQMLEDAQPQMLLACAAAGPLPASLANLPATPYLVLPQDRESLARLLAEDSDAPLPLPPEPDQRAYITFTSGTMGRPKGIVATHRPWHHFLGWHSQRFGFGGDDRFSMLSGLAHDPLLRDIFTPLWVGGRVCIPAGEILLVPEQLRAWMREKAITVAHLTPALGHVLSEGASAAELGALRFLFFGGEVLSRRTVERVRKLAPRACCVNFYGTTETPQAMGYALVATGETDPLPEQIPVGRGIDGVQLLVLGPAGQRLGIGELGEIHVRTPYLSLGYLNDPELTASKFCRTPQGRSEQDRMYATGDLGRYQADGQVRFYGRRDRQVSIRGFRVEIKEVETVLAACPGVRDCAVLIRERTPGDHVLRAYVVVEGAAVLDATAIRQRLHQVLPPYMVPETILELPELPLTPNGKIDERRLAAVEAVSVESGAEDLPQTDMELLLARIWQELLGLETVSVHDNFYDIGGHSLGTIQVITQLEQELGLRIHPREFTYQTLGQIASSLEHQGGAPVQGPAPTPGPAAKKDGVLQTMRRKMAAMVRAK